MLATSVRVPERSPQREGAACRPPKQSAVDVDLMQRLDAMHAVLGSGFAPPEALSSYLAFLDAMPRAARVGPRVRVAVALIDNVLAMDELKLEHRKLSCALDVVEAATYELLVRIGRKHAEIISHTPE